MITEIKMITVVFFLLVVTAVHAHNAKRCTGANETYLEYKSCLLTCDDLEDYSCDGETSYDPGCYCSEGFLRKNGICIPKDRCNTIGERNAECPKGEIFLKYRPCRENCDDPDYESCDQRKTYSPGCYCAPGYRRWNGVCIPKQECSDLRAKNGDEECGENEQYLRFKPCLITCGDLIGYKECRRRQYAPGCYCKQGYLRKDGKCVPKEKCLESREKGSGTCGINEVYLKYAPCLQTCANLERGTCDEEARRYAPGCYCAEGYFRRDGVCVSEEECLSVEPREKRESNEQYLEYEPCLQTCGDLASPKCDKKLEKYAPGCYCSEGYLRKGGLCVPRSQCLHHPEKISKTCGINEVFLVYKPYSENCGVQGKQKHDNEKQYAPGCYCYPGYLRRDGICIPKEKCSKFSTECGVNEEYSEYEPCPQTCGDLESQECDERSRRYSPGCYCREGYLRQNGVCVPKQDCYYNARDQLKECPINERYLEYKPCRENCDDQENSKCDNSNPYAPGCYCAKGYLRKGGECVPEYQCADSNEIKIDIA